MCSASLVVINKISLSIDWLKIIKTDNSFSRVNIHLFPTKPVTIKQSIDTDAKSYTELKEQPLVQMD